MQHSLPIGVHAPPWVAVSIFKDVQFCKTTLCICSVSWFRSSMLWQESLTASTMNLASAVIFSLVSVYFSTGEEKQINWPFPQGRAPGPVGPHGQRIMRMVDNSKYIFSALVEYFKYIGQSMHREHSVKN